MCIAAPELSPMPPKVFHEFSGRKPREQWPTEFDLEGVDRDHRVRSQKINQAQEETMGQSLSTNSFIGGASIDLNNPPRQAYNPRDHEYPKMLYHPTKKDPNWLAEFKRITLYNSLHPEKPQILPVVPSAFVVVQNAEQEEKQLKEGFQLRPPAEKEESEPENNETLCSRGCGRVPHRGACKFAEVTA